MNEFVFARADVRLLIWHAALYGLAAILQEARHDDLRVTWTRGMQPRGVVRGTGITPDVVGEAVHRHAVAHAHAESWVSQDILLGGKPRGLMSPRISRLDGKWVEHQSARRAVIDSLVDGRSWLDLRMVSALGEPAYWSKDRQGALVQDDGASRLEMQPRNQGSEFVGNRLRKLSAIVADRSTGAIIAGLDGSDPVDELGKDGATSSTPTGLSNVGPTDNALAWCALWGIAALPSTPRTGTQQPRGIATTAGHIGGRNAEWFYTPVWNNAWTISRLRALLVSQQLADVATRELRPVPREAPDATRVVASAAWLAARGVIGIMQFPIGVFGSTSAPERRALAGSPVSVSS